MHDDPEFISLKTACAIVGGDRPISVATYYRGIKAGRFPPLEHPTPGISRIRKRKLFEVLNRGNE